MAYILPLHLAKERGSALASLYQALIDRVDYDAFRAIISVLPMSYQQFTRERRKIAVEFRRRGISLTNEVMQRRVRPDEFTKYLSSHPSTHRNLTSLDLFTLELFEAERMLIEAERLFCRAQKRRRQRGAAEAR